jgi:hypothetical protein
MSWGKGQLVGVRCVQNSVENVRGHVGNPVMARGFDEGVEGALAGAKDGKRRVVRAFGGWPGSRPPLGSVGRGGRVFGAARGVRWLLIHRFVLLGAEPLGRQDLRFGGRVRGSDRGWGRTAVVRGSGRDQAFDRQDHRKSFDLAGHAASGRFDAESGQFPEPGQNLVAANVQLPQALGFLVHQFFVDGCAVVGHVGRMRGLALV